MLPQFLCRQYPFGALLSSQLPDIHTGGVPARNVRHQEGRRATGGERNPHDEQLHAELFFVGRQIHVHAKCKIPFGLLTFITCFMKSYIFNRESKICVPLQRSSIGDFSADWDFSFFKCGATIAFYWIGRLCVETFSMREVGGGLKSESKFVGRKETASVERLLESVMDWSCYVPRKTTE